VIDSNRKLYLNWSVAEARRKIKARAVEYKGGKCEVCGYCQNIAALDFHHKDPSEKDFQISRGNYLGWTKLVPELDKCTLLCSNCHREEHDALRSSRLKDQKRLAREQCQPKNPSVLVPCPQCGKEFFLSHCKFEERTNPCCSSTCASKQQEKVMWPSPDLLRVMVWRKPLLQIAKDLGVSDVAVKKRCNRLGILTPPRGYWAQQEALTLATTRFPPVSELRIRISTTSYKRLAGELGCDPRTLRNYLLRQATA
jgi:hypothetical protein